MVNVLKPQNLRIWKLLLYGRQLYKTATMTIGIKIMFVCCLEAVFVVWSCGIRFVVKVLEGWQFEFNVTRHR